MTAKLTPEELAAAAAYVRRVLPLPYVEKATGPDAFDCWGLARDCQRALFGRHLPIVTDETVKAIVEVMATARQMWPLVHKATHGALAVMSSTQARHIGVWLALDGGGVLHTAEGMGVKFETPLMLRAQGWSRMHFHDYAGHDYAGLA